MIFEEDPVQAEVLIRDAYAEHEKAHPRELGLHASDLIFCLRRGWYKNQPGAISAQASLKQMTMWLAGLGHHAILEAVGAPEQKKIVELACFSGSLHHHRITANMDALSLTNHGIEIKTTRKSSAAEWPDLWYYVEQLVTYLIFWGLEIGWLHVLFLSGDYKANRDAVLRSWKVQPSQIERALWFDEIVRRAHVVTTSPEPPLPERMAWECGYCDFASARGGPCTQDELAKGRKGDKTGIKSSSFFVLDELPEWVKREQA